MLHGSISGVEKAIDKSTNSIAFPRFDCKFLLATDASDSAIGAVLSQVQEGAEKVIAYWSRQLTKAERNYSTIEREALAIVKAVKEFYPYLYGHEFVLLTDHQRMLGDVFQDGPCSCSSSISQLNTNPAQQMAMQMGCPGHHPLN